MKTCYSKLLRLCSNDNQIFFSSPVQSSAFIILPSIPVNPQVYYCDRNDSEVSLKRLSSIGLFSLANHSHHQEQAYICQVAAWCSWILESIKTPYFYQFFNIDTVDNLSGFKMYQFNALYCSNHFTQSLPFIINHQKNSRSQ